MFAFGTKRTSDQRSAMSAFGGKADIAATSGDDAEPRTFLHNKPTTSQGAAAVAQAAAQPKPPHPRSKRGARYEKSENNI
jgi:hypothetical protein